MHLLAVILVIVVVLLVIVSRGYTVFVLEIKNGHISVKEGNASKGMLDDFRQALSQVRRGTIRGRSSSHGVKLSFTGDIDEPTAQRLRNILGLYQR